MNLFTSSSARGEKGNLKPVDYIRAFNFRSGEYWIGYKFASYYVGLDGWIWSDGSHNDYLNIWRENQKNSTQYGTTGSCASIDVADSVLQTRQCSDSIDNAPICQFNLDNYQRCRKEGKCLD